MSEEILVAANVVKSFGGVHAVNDVSFTVRPGERLAIVGENGAGKSTLMRTLAGLVTPDSGTVVVDGREVTAHPSVAQQAGVALVHQELALVPDLTVAENICLGLLPTTAGLVSRREIRSRAESALEQVGVKLDTGTYVRDLPMAVRQFVEIARAVARQPKILILDEPTASLTIDETHRLIRLLTDLAETGIAILFISHRIPEVYALCQRALVLRDGVLVRDLQLAEATPDQLVAAMVGRELDLQHHSRPGVETREPILRVEDLVSDRLHGVSLELRRGEILGIGGLVGSGRSELLRAIVGLDHRLGGSVMLRAGEGQGWSTVRGFRHSIDAGMAFLPEERRSEGVALTLSIADNVALPTISSRRSAYISTKTVAGMASEVKNSLRVKSRHSGQDVGELSGGNQQKIAIGKWLLLQPRVLLLDEPTRGVDVGAKQEIHTLIRRLADQGASVIFVSSDLPELIALADRIVVMKDGRLVGQAPAAPSEETLIALATGIGTSRGSTDV